MFFFCGFGSSLHVSYRVVLLPLDAAPEASPKKKTFSTIKKNHRNAAEIESTRFLLRGQDVGRTKKIAVVDSSRERTLGASNKTAHPRREKQKKNEKNEEKKIKRAKPAKPATIRSAHWPGPF